jgi:hypothetical protein
VLPPVHTYAAGRAKFDSMWQGMLSKTGLAVAAGVPHLRAAADLDNYPALDTWMHTWGVAENGTGGVGVSAPVRNPSSSRWRGHRRAGGGGGGQVLSQQQAMAAIEAAAKPANTTHQGQRKLAQAQRGYHQAEAVAAGGTGRSQRRLSQVQQGQGAGGGSPEDPGPALAARKSIAGVNLAEWRAGGYLTRPAGYVGRH